MAKMQILVRVSGLNWTVEVVANGSDFIVTDSKATARVLAAWLISVGAFAFAAQRELVAPVRRSNKINQNALVTRGSGKQVFIWIGSVTRSEHCPDL
jgi:hypothetical protein